MKTPQEWFDYHHKTKLWTPGDPPVILELARLIQEDTIRYICSLPTHEDVLEFCSAVLGQKEHQP